VAIPGHLTPFTHTGRPVRVCFLIDDLSRAGTEMQLLALLQAFDRTLVEPYLVLLDGESDESRALEPSHCPVMRLGVKRLLSRRGITAGRWFARFLRRRNIDVLQTYFLDSFYFGAPIARWVGVPKVVRVRNNLGYWLTLRHRFLNWLYRRWVDRTMTNSAQGRTALESEGVKPHRIAVLENGIDVSRFSEEPPRFTGEIRIGAVANLRPVKCLDRLIRSAAELLQRHPNLRFDIAGEGNQRDELEALAQSLKLGDRFRLFGAVSDIPNFLASLDIAVLCSNSEGMSNALLEYMAAGRAIVATRVGAADQLIRDGQDGILIAPNDDDALSAAIEKLIQDPDRARRLGLSARRRAVESFSRVGMRRRFEQFYHGLMAGS
jgi:glycosyltransferase involved in cell wall biosynthesis